MNISWSDCDVQQKVDCVRQPVMTNSGVGPRRSSKALPKENLPQKKFMFTVWWSAAVWSITVFWNLVKPFHLRSMLSKSVRCSENCNACSWYWSTEWAQFSMTMPNHTSHNQCFKSWMNRATKFCLICHIHLTSCQLTTTFSRTLRTFCRESASKTNKRQKILSKSSLTHEAWIFLNVQNWYQILKKKKD